MTEESTPVGTPEDGLMVKEINALNIVWGAFGFGTECTGIVENITEPETGGIFTKYLGCNYLFKGYPNMRMVEAIAIPKKIISKLPVLISEKSVKFFLGMIFLFYLILPKRIKKQIVINFWNYFLDIAYISLAKIVLLENKYCLSVKEIYRASEVLFQKIKGEEMLLRVRKTRDIVCMILEYDYAYRARLQDVLPYLDKEGLKKNPRYELGRIFDILIGRENDIRMQADWRGLKMIILNALRIGALRNFIVELLTEINLDMIKPDEADWYYVLDRHDYWYGGISHKERMEQKKELDIKVGNRLPKVIFKEKK